MKIGRNDPCWCDSGKKFKHCHKLRHLEKPLPSGALVEKLSKEFQRGTCLHPEANKELCGRPVNAHTISKSRSLKAILDSTNHVFTFYPLEIDSDKNPILHKKGWNQASTFPGFCSIHDSPIFESIERDEFTLSANTCFLLAYRAVCREVFQKVAVTRSMPILRRNVDRGLSYDEQVNIQKEYQTRSTGAEKGLKNLSKIKSYLDKHLLENDFLCLKHSIIKFLGNISILTAGAITPNIDVNGNTIQTLHDTNASMEQLVISMIPKDTGGIIILSWLSEHKKIEKFVEGLTSISKESLPSYIVQYIFEFIENTYFSSEWWNSLEKDMKQHITSLAILGNPYYFHIPFKDKINIPWTIESIYLLP